MLKADLENTQIYTQIFKFELVYMNLSPFYVDKMLYFRALYF